MSAAQPLRIGVVLTGGGAKGAYQIGCLRALQDAGLTPVAAISGVSVGAIHGVMLAAGKLDEAEAIWRCLRWRDVATVATHRLRLFPVWLLAGVASEFSPFKVWRLSDSVTHPARWRRYVYPLACLATGLGLWAVRHVVPGGGVVRGFAIAFAACAALAFVHEWLRPHFLGSSPISHGPLVTTLEQALTEEDCAHIRSQGVPVYATTSNFRPYTHESVPWGGWAPQYVRLDRKDRASVLDVLVRGSALPGFSSSPGRPITTIVDGSWTDNVPAAPLLFDRAVDVDLLFVIYLKPRIRHRLRHNSLFGLASFLMHKAVATPTDEVVNLRRWAAVRWEAARRSTSSPATTSPRIVQVAPSTRVGNFFTGTIWFSHAQAARLIALGHRDMNEAISTLASGTGRVAASLRTRLAVNPAVGRGQQPREPSHDPAGMMLEVSSRRRTRRGADRIADADAHSDA
jgi:predicted acylesterase/phospholipase RssA